MKIYHLIWLISFPLQFAFAQNGLYKEKHRPQIHFSPPAKWMNDPNGMVYYQGEYHLFYQYYPDASIWGPMHWGHAVSKDLIHWQNLPIALYPDSLGYIFSGSVVIDWQNTSNLGSKENPAMVAIFTYHSEEGYKQGRKDFQNQGIAYSLDKGRTWTKYAQNPVLKNPGMQDFRDPKVFWHANTQKWLMSLAIADHIGFYSSPNLKDWTFESEFGKDYGAHGGVWECPDLFPLKGDNSIQKWVLLVSINPGGSNGGSATQYFVGDFDGHAFKPEANIDSQKALWVDSGTDNYAGVTWSGIPETDNRRIFLGWMSNWNYANKVPTEKWRSAMTLPRTLALYNTPQGYRLQSQVVNETHKLRTKTLEIHPKTVEDKLDISPVKSSKSGAYEVILSFEITQQNIEFGLEWSNFLGEKLLIGYDGSRQEFYIDRSKAGKKDFSPDFAGRHTTIRTEKGNLITFHIFLDVASAEVFADDGKTVMTDIFFPTQDFNKLYLFTNQAISLKKTEVYSLKSIWK